MWSINPSVEIKNARLCAFLFCSLCLSDAIQFLFAETSYHQLASAMKSSTVLCNFVAFACQMHVLDYLLLNFLENVIQAVLHHTNFVCLNDTIHFVGRCSSIICASDFPPFLFFGFLSWSSKWWISKIQQEKNKMHKCMQPEHAHQMDAILNLVDWA